MNDIMLGLFVVFSISYIMAAIVNYSQASAEERKQKEKEQRRKVHLSAILGDKNQNRCGKKFKKDREQSTKSS